MSEEIKSQWTKEELTAFAEHHYQTGVAVGRAQVTIEGASRDIKRVEEAVHFLKSLDKKDAKV